MTKTKKNTVTKYPTVSVCTPTFNRRPFLPYVIKCFENQTYPKDKIEWIVVDDGTDKVEDLFTGVPQVKYYKYENQMLLGKKRNIANSKCNGDIIIYMDDDDYYPPERISHAVESLMQNPTVLCAGSSEMHLYFKHIQKMYQFGPYGKNHATAATFAFKKELLNMTSYDETAALAEEKHFLKDYTIPFVQLDPLKTILVFSHIHNSFDKKKLLEQGENPYMKLSNKTVDDFVKEENIKKFFMEDIDEILNNYQPGHPENKPEVLKQIEVITKKREDMMKVQIGKQNQYNEILRSKKINAENGDPLKKINEMNIVLNELFAENNKLKDKVKYLEEKIRSIINEKIQEKKNNIVNNIVNNSADNIVNSIADEN